MATGLDMLIDGIKEEHRQFGGFHKRFKISGELARELFTMTVDDWKQSGRGCLSETECDKLVSLFIKKGEEAVSELHKFLYDGTIIFELDEFAVKPVVAVV